MYVCLSAGWGKFWNLMVNKLIEKTFKKLLNFCFADFVIKPYFPLTKYCWAFFHWKIERNLARVFCHFVDILFVFIIDEVVKRIKLIRKWKKDIL